MTITLDMAPEAEEELRGAAARQGKTLEALMQQAAVEVMLADLKNRSVPQSLEELKPRLQPPPGKTAMDMIIGQWPGDETDEEVNRALEELS